MEDRAERARKVARILEMENERKKRKEKEKGQRKTDLKASTETYFTHDATAEVLETETSTETLSAPTAKVGITSRSATRLREFGGGIS